MIAATPDTRHRIPQPEIHAPENLMNLLRAAPGDPIENFLIVDDTLRRFASPHPPHPPHRGTKGGPGMFSRWLGVVAHDGILAQVREKLEQERRTMFRRLP